MSSGKLYILQYRPGGEIIEMDTDGGNRRTLVGNLLGNVDGIVIDKKTKTLYWTNMGPRLVQGMVSSSRLTARSNALILAAAIDGY
jgi:hypothetical protein